ncbi:DNA topoisomerase 3-alpha [Coemansia sp. RSA 1286]|nr:DNA topoisomerase 3-alpha [Coemansia sp. RSA 1286]
MTSVAGHLVEMDFTDAYRRWNACNPVSLFTAPIFKDVGQKLEDVARNIQQEARSATHLYIWTDCDREGEAIGGEVAEVCRKTNPRLIVRRAHFSSVLPQEIHHAMQNTRELDMRLVNAVEARSELDLRIGAALSRFQTLRLQSQFDAVKDKIISYGPCQFPTLGFVVDQFLRVESFVPETFWFIYLQHDQEDGSATFTWKRGRVFDQETGLALYAQCVRMRTVHIDSVRARPKEKWRPLPLTTVELQKCCAKFLRIAPDTAMSIAEGLYNQGFISYPRTETDQFDNGMNLRDTVAKLVQQPGLGEYAQRLVNGGFKWPRHGRNNDKAHPPIHPVAAAPSLQGDPRRVYEFVTRRFLACCSENAKGQATEVAASIAGEHFSTAGLMITERNYLDIYPYDRWSESTVPLYRQGQTFEPTIFELRTGQTSAPRLLRFADLIEAMDKNGIGTDATHADHIKKIIDREYIFKGADDSLTPSTLGIGLKEGYDAIGLELSLCKPYLRREMERELKRICEGSKTRDDVVRESVELYKAVYTKTVSEVASLENALSRCLQEQPKNDPGGVWTPTVEPEEVCACPNADGGKWTLRTRQNNAGWFIGCTCYPQCRRSVWLPDSVASISVGSGMCVECSGDANGPAKLVDIRFRPGSVPPGVPSQYSGCVRGCDELLNELFELRQSRSSVSGAANGASSISNISAGNDRMRSRPSSAQSAHFIGSDQPPQQRSNIQPAPLSNNARTGYSGNTGYSGFSGQPNRLQPSHTDTPLSNHPLCNCGTLSIQRVTTKEGPNKGRAFYVCSKPQESRCDFFQWVDQASSGTTYGSSTMSRTRPSPSAQPFSGSGSNTSYSYSNSEPQTKPKCKCGLYSTLKQATKSGPNQGREYFVCTKTFQGCGFVCWKDEVDSHMSRPSSVPPDSTCYKCNGLGHWANECPSGEGGGSAGASGSGYNQAQSSRGGQRRTGGSGSSGRGRARGGGISKPRRGGKGRAGGRSGASSNKNSDFQDADANFEFWD